mmetsp:Transcript_168110/g.539907  ORF Transcript_168110/g.539907 Transcript_168110/m.539907 type:complete len:200 (+) Transcript_168110:648-1247(+)
MDISCGFHGYLGLQCVSMADQNSCMNWPQLTRAKLGPSYSGHSPARGHSRAGQHSPLQPSSPGFAAAALPGAPNAKNDRPRWHVRDLPHPALHGFLHGSRCGLHLPRHPTSCPGPPAGTSPNPRPTHGWLASRIWPLPQRSQYGFLMRSFRRRDRRAETSRSLLAAIRWQAGSPAPLRACRRIHTSHGSCGAKSWYPRR